jgi:NTE family protein
MPAPFMKMKIARNFLVMLVLVQSAAFPGRTYGAVDEEKFLTRLLWSESVSLPRDKRPKIGLALGGGGARGYAHIGVMRVLEEEGMPIDIIVGTSVGALVGALYCSGVPLDDIEKMSENIGWDKLTDISTHLWYAKAVALYRYMFSTQLFSTERMENYIARNIGNKQFYELKIPFACVATDLTTGEKIIFQEGDVASAVRASANMPGIFAPVEYRHRLLIDGGLVDNVPTDLAKYMKADIIFAVDIHSDFTKYAASNILLVLNQAIYIQGSLMSREELKFADLVINPQVGDVNAYDFWRYQECIDSGMMACRKMMPEMKKIIIDRAFKWMLAH